MVKPLSLENNRLQVTAPYAGQRLDNFLLSRLALTRGHLYKLIRTGQIRVNGSRQAPSARLLAGDQIRLPPFLCQLPQALPPVLPERVTKTLKAAIIFENDAFLVLQKPAGIPAHAGSGLQYGVIEILRQQLPNYPDLALVHRLDRATSGLLLLAKTPFALRALLAQWPQVQKTYLGLVTDPKGQWQPGTQRQVALPLLRLPSEDSDKSRGKVIVDSAGKSAQTNFMCLASAKNTCWRLLLARLHSGRMHQIRVHAAASDFPMVGDVLYAPKATQMPPGFTGLALHAVALQFFWQEELLHFQAEPTLWQSTLAALFPDFSLTLALEKHLKK